MMQANLMARPASDAVNSRLRAAFTPEVSRSIRVARVMCITLMMTVHIWPGATAITTADVPLVLHWIYEIIIKEFGVASVPLLSVVSGLLFYRSTLSGKWAALMSSKVRTLLVPMAIWSALLLLMFIAKALAAGDHAFFDVPALDWVNRVFGITAPPINLPLAFLRDIFMCCLIGLAVVRLEQLLPWSGKLMLIALVSVEIYSEGIVMLRPQVLMFFGIGLMIGMMPPRSLVLPWTVVATIVVVDLVVQYSSLGQTETWKELTSVLHRFAVAMLMWRTSIAIVRRDGWFCRAIERVEPMIFLVFCSHMLTILVMATLFTSLGLWVTSPVFPLIFALQIPVVYGVAFLLNAVGEAYAPRLLALLSSRKYVPGGQPVSGKSVERQASGILK